MNISFYLSFTNISESKRIKHHYKLKLQRQTFALFILIPCPVAKAATGSTTLATETVVSPLIGGWWGQGVARVLTRRMIKFVHLWIFPFIFPLCIHLVNHRAKQRITLLMKCRNLHCWYQYLFLDFLSFYSWNNLIFCNPMKIKIILVRHSSCSSVFNIFRLFCVFFHKKMYAYVYVYDGIHVRSCACNCNMYARW